MIGNWTRVGNPQCSGFMLAQAGWQFDCVQADRVKPWVNFDMPESRGREESFGLKGPSIVGWDRGGFWAVHRFLPVPVPSPLSPVPCKFPVVPVPTSLSQVPCPQFAAFSVPVPCPQVSVLSPLSPSFLSPSHISPVLFPKFPCGLDQRLEVQHS